MDARPPFAVQNGYYIAPRVAASAGRGGGGLPLYLPKLVLPRPGLIGSPSRTRQQWQFLFWQCRVRRPPPLIGPPGSCASPRSAGVRRLLRLGGARFCPRGGSSADAPPPSPPDGVVWERSPFRDRRWRHEGLFFSLAMPGRCSRGSRARGWLMCRGKRPRVQHRPRGTVAVPAPLAGCGRPASRAVTHAGGKTPSRETPLAARGPDTARQLCSADSGCVAPWGLGILHSLPPPVRHCTAFSRRASPLCSASDGSLGSYRLVLSLLAH